MSSASSSNPLSKIQTVLGNVNAEQLGRTLTHEHLAIEFTHFYRKPPSQIAHLLENEIYLENVGYLRQYPYSCRYNLTLNDNNARNAVINDVAQFKKFGGGTIVENTTEGLDRNIHFLKDVSLQTGVHIVAGTGYYIADMQQDSWIHSTTEELCKHMVKELTIGCREDASVKAGFMGEIASVWPLRDFEKKAIKAAAEVQKEVICGVSFHPHRDPEAPFEIMRLFLESGGRAHKTVMSHLDRTLLDDEKLMEFAKLGCYCQFDLFGTEVSYYQLNVDTDMPSDAQRLNKMLMLDKEGYTDRILMSHDIHTKHRLIEYGGHGYSHILNNILPRMKTKGFSQAAIDTITIDNPARWLNMEA